MKVSIIIPAYNESDRIEKNMDSLNDWCKQNLSEYEIIIVNDGSKDNTWEIVKSKYSTLPFKDGGYGDNRGKGGALKAGVKLAEGDIIITTDCDLAYGTDVIKSALEVFKKFSETDMLIGSRTKHENGFGAYPFYRKLASKIYFSFLSFYSRVKVSDSQCGFKCYKTESAKKLFSELVTTSFAFDLEIIMRAQKAEMILSEIPVKIINHSESKISLIKDAMRMLKDVSKIKKLLK